MGSMRHRVVVLLIQERRMIMAIYLFSLLGHACRPFVCHPRKWVAVTAVEEAFNSLFTLKIGIFTILS